MESRVEFEVYQGSATPTRWSAPLNLPWERWPAGVVSESQACAIDLRDVPEALQEIEVRMNQLQQARARLMRVQRTAYDDRRTAPAQYAFDELSQQGSLAESRSRSYAQLTAALGFGHTVDQMAPPPWPTPWRKKQEDNDFTNRDEGGVV